MPYTYATYAQFTAVYSISGVSQTELENGWLVRGAEELNSRLGGFFTTPFSSDNTTARNLSIDMAYAGILRRTTRVKDSEDLQKWIDKRITDLTMGAAPMITDSGNSLFADTGAAQGFWSTDQDFKSTFDMRTPEKQRVSLDRLDDLDDQDN